MQALFGPTLRSKTGGVETKPALAGKVVGIYFSAHWCGACRAFTPRLKELYNNLEETKLFEVVFISFDADEHSFEKYYKDMPWLALSFNKFEFKSSLSKTFHVKEIPTLILIDEDSGEIISKDGRGLVLRDPKGEHFPWMPRKVNEILGNQFLNSHNEVVSHPKTELICLYFGAMWCPHCRGFSIKLKELYTRLKLTERSSFEFIFVSSDREEEDFNTYRAQQPWLALPFNKRAEKEELAKMFSVHSIPALVILDGSGSVLCKDARKPLLSDPLGVHFPWKPEDSEEDFSVSP